MSDVDNKYASFQIHGVDANFLDRKFTSLKTSLDTNYWGYNTNHQPEPITCVPEIIL